MFIMDKIILKIDGQKIFENFRKNVKKMNIKNPIKNLNLKKPLDI
jgi:hypothetical protein